ncbi:MAG: flavodoxin [Clostridia bacterium]|nr:flavodoxin [Clostridia bacterium]
MAKRILVAYFSASGITEKVAKLLADHLGADLSPIVPATPYTKADLDWQDKHSRSTLEMKDEEARPAMLPADRDPADYDIICLGYPIWWYVAPRIINTYLETYDFSGKKIIAFATSGSSDIGNSEAELKKQYPDLTFLDGKLMNGVLAKEDLTTWVDGLQLD